MNMAICAVCMGKFYTVTLNERVCQGCLADAKLGRLVRSDALEKVISSGSLADAYFCTRVWEAWGYGTMSQDDFENVDVGRVTAEIREALERAMGEGK